jgi:diguanylate cyclase (GGDEF)-like protein
VPWKATRLPRFLTDPFFLRFSLRANLLLLLACFSLFLIFDRGRDILKERSDRIVHAQADLLAAAQAIARRQADIISQARAILRLATAIPQTDGTSLTACQMPFQRIVDDRPWLEHLALFDTDGKVLCMTGERRMTTSIADRSYFRKAIETRGFVLSDYLVSRLDQQPILAAAMPRTARGKIVSVVVATIDIEWLNRLAAETGSRSKSDVHLVDSGGTIIAAYPTPEIWVGRTLAQNPEFWNVLRSADGVFESAALGEQRIVSHVKLEDTQGIMAVSRARGDVLASANSQAQRSVAKIVIIGLLCFIVIWLGGERLVLRPIEDLTKGAARLGSGDLTARVRTTRLSPELRLLGETFNAMADQLAEHETELKRANTQLLELAATDGLTGIANRRRFDEQLDAEWSRATRSAEPLALLAVDVDHFKKYNDRYGHLAGDDCLRRVAELLRKVGRRPGDVAARVGGEEFAVLLPGASMADAVAIAQALRGGVSALKMEHLDSPEKHVTISIGVAALLPRSDQAARTILDAADAALYRAKRSGRNRVSLNHDPIALAS